MAALKGVGVVGKRKIVYELDKEIKGVTAMVAVKGVGVVENAEEKCCSSGTRERDRSYAACRSLLRGEDDAFIKDFTCNLGRCTVLIVESSRLLLGLVLDATLFVERLVVEMDSKISINLVEGFCPPSCQRISLGNGNPDHLVFVGRMEIQCSFP
ncbi:hypothetical protein RIF29_18846 [Crotalaria pallida]|uniref:Uncharacterized protein n=1 Tax=Crotalaria pallida TaxID=3830 RepID=A0AAN9EYG0_CROPI